MKPRNHFHFLIPAARLLFAALLLLQLFASSAGIALAEEDQPGAVYTLTHAATGNEVLAYARGGDGSLKPLPSLQGLPRGLAGLAGY